MNGLFKIKKFDARGFSDDDFNKAISNGSIKNLISRLDVKQELECRNRIFDNVAGVLLDKLFSLSNCGWPYYNDDVTRTATLASISLLNLDSDTTSYTEDWGNNSINCNMANISWAVDSSDPNTGAKGFYGRCSSLAGAIEQNITANSNRDEVQFRSVFLYLPTEAVSNEIRSIGIYYMQYADSSGAVGLVGRVRLKDADGNKITLTKTNNEVLMFEYIFKLVSI
jgi:hypothetical protein